MEQMEQVPLGLRSRLLRRYKQGPLVWCVRGLYTCHWGPLHLYSTGPESGDHSCNKLLLLCLLSQRQRISLHWTHKVGVGVVLFFSVVAISVLSDLWSGEWSTLLLSFQVTAPYLHVGGVLLMTALSWPVAGLTFQTTGAGRRALVGGPFLLLLLALYLVPLGLFSPCIKDKTSLGPRPALIGHRGAPMLAPENTLMSFEKAVKCGCVGLETDVTLSVDGMPFLMHDLTLLRTTDVKERFPDRSGSPAAMFTWTQLQTLNAGAWFLSRNPFRSVGSLGEEEKVRAQNQSICSLLDFLQLAAHSRSLVIFDLYRPPKGHPYRDTWLRRTLDVLLNQSSILSSQVLWLPSHLRSLVQEMDPDLQQTSGSRLPLQEMQSNNIVKLNLHYSHVSPQLVREYEAANISVNLYVVSEPWLYSVAWCSGVQSVTTNAPQRLSSMTQPLLLMSPEEYSLMWTLTDLLSLALVLLIFWFHWWREEALTLSSGPHTALDTGIYSRFRTELSEVWSMSSVSSHTDTATSICPLTPSRAPPSPRPSNMSAMMNRAEPPQT